MIMENFKGECAQGCCAVVIGSEGKMCREWRETMLTKTYLRFFGRIVVHGPVNFTARWLGKLRLGQRVTNTEWITVNEIM